MRSTIPKGSKARADAPAAERLELDGELNRTVRLDVAVLLVLFLIGQADIGAVAVIAKTNHIADHAVRFDVVAEPAEDAPAPVKRIICRRPDLLARIVAAIDRLFFEINVVHGSIEAVDVEVHACLHGVNVEGLLVKARFRGEAEIVEGLQRHRADEIRLRALEPGIVLEAVGTRDMVALAEACPDEATLREQQRVEHAGIHASAALDAVEPGEAVMQEQARRTEVEG